MAKAGRSAKTQSRSSTKPERAKVKSSKSGTKPKAAPLEPAANARAVAGRGDDRGKPSPAIKTGPRRATPASARTSQGAPGRGRTATQIAAVVDEGSTAPSFSLLDQDSQMFSSFSLEGRAYVLYFYPKDDTPGCTKEACDFRDSLNRFASRGIVVVGVSPDPPGSHARFRDKYGISFRLLSDTDRELAQAYGVWVKKQNYGREYMGIERSTFLIDAAGIVRKAWRGVRVPGHVENVLFEAEKLS
jgi:thioredoxin-dependent peroxiredoxin